MQHPKVVLWREMYHLVGHELLAEGGADVVVVDSSQTDELKQALHGARALWVRTPERVTADILDAAPELVAASTSGFGTDNVDIPAATERGILVVNHVGFGRVPVAEHSIMMILAAAKRVVWGDAATRDGSGWAARSALDFIELDGRTVGVVGIGHIGAEIARKLRYGFRCRVLGYDPYVDNRLARVVDVEMFDDLEAILRQSEVLVLVPELTDETRLMIGADELAMLPQGAIVVNTGRGHVLDADALDAALRAEHLFGAGVDVVYPEPLPPEHPLLSNPKVTFSPHIAGGTQETSEQLARSAAAQILTTLAGKLPACPVNPQAWDLPASRRPLSAEQ